jgi:hypothetical protein
MRRYLWKRAWRVFAASPWQLRAMVLASEGMCARPYATVNEDGGIVYEHPCADDCPWLDAYLETIDP